MNTRNNFLLVLLASIWGTSFLFMKILAPIFGPIVTAGTRILIGGLFVLLVIKIQRITLNVKPHLKTLTVIAFLQYALPFALFSYAAIFIPSTLSVILNSLTPIFVAFLAFLIFKDKLPYSKIIGLVLGLSGVVIVSVTNEIKLDNDSIIGIIACSVAALSYALASIYMKAYAKNIDSSTIAVSSQLIAATMLLPLSFLVPIRGDVTNLSIILLLIFGIVCSGVASIIFFYLQKTVGPLKATLVTLLQPIFGVFWGVTILGESININFIIGTIIVVFGVYLVLQPGKELVDNNIANNEV